MELPTNFWDGPFVNCVAVVVELVSGAQLFAIPGLQHSILPFPSLSPGVCSNSCPLSQWYQGILCHALLLLLSVFPSMRVLTNELALCIRWPKYWSVSISSSSEYSELISFRIWLADLFAVQETLKSLLQHYSSKESILECSTFFMV